MLHGADDRMCPAENAEITTDEQPTAAAEGTDTAQTDSVDAAATEALRRRGYPYRLVGSVRFYDRREIRSATGIALTAATAASVPARAASSEA